MFRNTPNPDLDLLQFLGILAAFSLCVSLLIVCFYHTAHALGGGGGGGALLSKFNSMIKNNVTLGEGARYFRISTVFILSSAVKMYEFSCILSFKFCLFSPWKMT